MTGKQKRFLRSLGHHLEPVVQVGQRGISDEVIRKVDDELDAHELIKLKVGDNSPVVAQKVGDELAERLLAQVAQVVGRTVLLYRPHKENSHIRLPKVKDKG